MMWNWPPLGVLVAHVAVAVLVTCISVERQNGDGLMGFAQCHHCDQEMEHIRQHTSNSHCLEEAIAQKEDLARQCLRAEATLRKIRNAVQEHIQREH